MRSSHFNQASESLELTVQALGLEAPAALPRPHMLRDERGWVRRDDQMRSLGLFVDLMWSCLYVPSFQPEQRITVFHGANALDGERLDSVLRAVVVQDGMAKVAELDSDPVRSLLSTFPLDLGPRQSATIDGYTAELQVFAQELESKLYFGNPCREPLVGLMEGVFRIRDLVLAC